MKLEHSAGQTTNMGVLLGVLPPLFLGRHRFVGSLEPSVARPPGLEPGTYSLEGCCTIQLCYGRSRAAQNGREARILHQAGGACAL